MAQLFRTVASVPSGRVVARLSLVLILALTRTTASWLITHHRWPPIPQKTTNLSNGEKSTNVDFSPVRALARNADLRLDAEAGVGGSQVRHHQPEPLIFIVHHTD